MIGHAAIDKGVDTHLTGAGQRLSAGVLDGDLQLIITRLGRVITPLVELHSRIRVVLHFLETAHLLALKYMIQLDGAEDHGRIPAGIRHAGALAGVCCINVAILGDLRGGDIERFHVRIIEEVGFDPIPVHAKQLLDHRDEAVAGDEAVHVHGALSGFGERVCGGHTLIGVEGRPPHVPGRIGIVPQNPIGSPDILPKDIAHLLVLDVPEDREQIYSVGDDLALDRAPGVLVEAVDVQHGAER